MRVTITDCNLLCDDFMSRNLKGQCLGCRLKEELDKPVARRSKSVLARLSVRVLKLRQQKRTRSVT